MPPSSLTHTHTHICTHTHTHTNTYAEALTLSLSHTHTQRQSLSLSLSLSLSHTHTHTHTHTHNYPAQAIDRHSGVTYIPHDMVGRPLLTLHCTLYEVLDSAAKDGIAVLGQPAQIDIVLVSQRFCITHASPQIRMSLYPIVIPLHSTQKKRLMTKIS